MQVLVVSICIGRGAALCAASARTSVGNLSTRGLALNKSNWANTLDAPPFEAYAVTCGITFTFGGLRIDNDANVINTDGLPIRGLYAAGELVAAFSTSIIQTAPA